MRAVIQRVSRARVVIDGQEHSRIGTGILVLLGVEKEDTAEDASACWRGESSNCGYSKTKPAR